MVSKCFLRGSRELIERSDGRYKFFQCRDERCLSALVTGRGISRIEAIPPEAKVVYLEVLGELNDQYFEARAFERDVRGKFYRYDEEAERRLRSKITEELSRSVEQLRRLLSAQDDLLEAMATAETKDSADTKSTTTSGHGVRGGYADEMQGTKGVQGVQGSQKAEEAQRTEEVHSATPSSSSTNIPRERLMAVGRQTNRVARGGWYPILESYDHSLDPGERIAEGKRRRRQRRFGQQSVPGVAQLLDTPLFEQLTNDDLAELRELDRFAPPEAQRIASRMNNRHEWLLEE
ncbi:hypothetical protein [Haladaptatus sp. NG-SE-30]